MVGPIDLSSRGDLTTLTHQNVKVPGRTQVALSGYIMTSRPAPHACMAKSSGQRRGFEIIANVILPVPTWSTLLIFSLVIHEGVLVAQHNIRSL